MKGAEKEIASLRRQVARLEKRVKVFEALLYTMLTGRVEIQGVMHLVECDKRNDKKNACSCGAVPIRSDLPSQGKRG
jgi:hypothetical protein